MDEKNNSLKGEVIHKKEYFAGLGLLGLAIACAIIAVFGGYYLVENRQSDPLPVTNQLIEGAVQQKSEELARVESDLERAQKMFEIAELESAMMSDGAAQKAKDANGTLREALDLIASDSSAEASYLRDQIYLQQLILFSRWFYHRQIDTSPYRMYLTNYEALPESHLKMIETLLERIDTSYKIERQNDTSVLALRLYISGVLLDSFSQYLTDDYRNKVIDSIKADRGQLSASQNIFQTERIILPVILSGVYSLYAESVLPGYTVDQNALENMYSETQKRLYETVQDENLRLTTDVFLLRLYQEIARNGGLGDVSMWKTRADDLAQRNPQAAYSYRVYFSQRQSTLTILTNP
jgi:hypothetical protein